MGSYRNNNYNKKKLVERTYGYSYVRSGTEVNRGKKTHEKKAATAAITPAATPAGNGLRWRPYMGRRGNRTNVRLPGG